MRLVRRAVSWAGRTQDILSAIMPSVTDFIAVVIIKKNSSTVSLQLVAFA
jgi:hypothetical protein